MNMNMRSLISLVIVVSLASLYAFTGTQGGCTPQGGHNMERYTEKGVFLVSDQDWAEVVSLVPAAIWEDATRQSHKYPFLIYHTETDGAFDADAIMLFLKRYNADKVFTLGALPQALRDAIEENVTTTIEELTVPAIYSFWNESETGIVFVQADYELALLASTYASLKGLPMIVHGTPGVPLDGKDVTLVGGILCPENAASCTQIAQDADAMRAVLAQETGGEKIVLVRPDDLDIYDTGIYATDYGSLPITEFSGKMSLAAAPLAAAKSQLILSAASGDAEAIDYALEDDILSLGISPEYLTIAASPAAIPMGTEVNGAYQYELDYQVYGSLGFGQVPEGLGLYGNDMLPDLYTGRIFGVTVSDASAYVANVLFYARMMELLPGRYPAKAVIDDDGGADHIHVAHRWAEIYQASGIDYAFNQEATLTSDDYEHVYAVYYAGHGWEEGAGFLSTEQLRYHIEDLFPASAYISACHTCYYKPAFASTLLCAQVLRNGGLAYSGAVGYGNDENKIQFLASLMVDGMDLGQAFLNMRREVQDTWYFHHMSPYVLVGDPTFRPSIMPAVDPSYFPDPQVAEEWIDDLTFQVDVGFDRAVDLTEVEFYRHPIMPSAQSPSDLYGIPLTHYEFKDIDETLTPSALHMTYQLGEDVSMEATLGSCLEREFSGGFFPYRYIDCVPQHIEVCVAGECDEANGGQVSGVTILERNMLIYYGDGVRTYNMMATTFEPAEGSAVATFLAAAPVREVDISMTMSLTAK